MENARKLARRWIGEGRVWSGMILPDGGARVVERQGEEESSEWVQWEREYDENGKCLTRYPTAVRGGEMGRVVIGENVLIGMKGKPKNGKAPQWFEIWTSAGRKPGRVEFGTVHGDISFDPRLMGIAPLMLGDGKFILYVAEEARSPNSTSRQYTDDDRTTAARFDSSWGETFSRSVRTCIYVASLQGNQGDLPYSVLNPEHEAELADYSLTQPVIMGEHLIFVAVSHFPYKMGLVHCVNRPSRLVRVRLNQSCDRPCAEGPLQWLTESVAGGDHCVTSPRVHPVQPLLVYLSYPEPGPHNQAAKLRLLDSEGMARTLVDVVEYPLLESGFPGLYLQNLPRQPFVRREEKECIVLSSIWFSQVRALIVDIESGSVKFWEEPTGVDCRNNSDTQPAHGSNQTKSCEIWECNYSTGKILASKSNLANPPAAVWLTSSDFSSECVLGSWPNTLDIFRDVVRIEAPEHEGGAFEAILTLPTRAKSESLSTPVVLIPHGGPHSAYSDSFMTNVAALSEAGFAVILVNYRGSLGYGMRALRSLPGRIGEQDVADCLAALDACLERYPLLDRNRVAVYGGSHGGFLSGHLAGQHGNRFARAALANPVINIASMMGSTDISDWCLYEALGDHAPAAHLLTPDHVSKMAACSPLAYVGKVNIPILLLVGQDDLRVPPHQARHYFAVLRARGVNVSMYTYPGNGHALGSSDASIDALAHLLSFLTPLNGN